MGRFPGETSCLTLVWAVLDLYLTHAKKAALPRSNASASTRMRYADDEQPATDEEVTAA